MKEESLAILEFDNDKDAFLNPNPAECDFRLPKKCIALFFKDVVEYLASQKEVEEIGSVEWETGKCSYYKIKNKRGEDVCFYHSWVGSSISAAVLDLTISLGVNRVIAIGGAGCLIDAAEGGILIPTRGVRDEGTSFHYCKPSRYIEPSHPLSDEIINHLNNNNIPYLTGMTWTTDGFYRETRSKIKNRVDEGCVSVEMEFAALCAVTNFRDVEFSQILYFGDKVDGAGEYDERGWQLDTNTRLKIFKIALEAI